MVSNRLAPIARRQGALALAVLAIVLVVPGRAAAQCAITHTQKLAAPDPSTNRWFGDEIAIDGNVAFIGSQFDDYLCPGIHNCDAGSVQVFARVAGAWAPAQRLTPSQAEAHDFFGLSIALGGNRALIGAYGHDTGVGNNVGYVYDFRLEGGQWVEHGIIEPSDPGSEAWFGWRVSMDGTVAAVAAQLSGAAGAVYVFRFTNGEWEEEQKLTPADAGGAANFGHSLAMQGGKVIVGANNDNGVGSASVYVHDGQAWVLEQKITPPLGSPGDRFGESVAIRGSYALVGATSEDGGADSSGAVHAYWFDGQDWLHIRLLVPSDLRVEAHFGTSVHLSEGLAVVSATGHDEAGEGAGQVYAFTFDGMDWTEAARLRPAEVDEIDHFGSALAVQGSEVMIGASGDDDPCGGGICGAGAVYVFRPLANCNANAAIDWCEIQAAQVPDCNANGIPDACDIASGVSADCDGNGVPDACDLLAGADCNDNGVPDACDIAQSTSDDCNSNGLPDECDPYAPPGGEQKLLAPAAAPADRFGSAVAVFGDVAVTGAPFRDSQGVDAGAAYVLRRDGNDWAHEATLVGSDITAVDGFGWAVAAERDLVLVGAELAPTGGITSGGAVYAYRREGGAWVETARIVPSVSQHNSRFGRSVAICGDLLIVGAHMEGEPGFSQRGAAYVFRHDGLAWVQEARLLPPAFAAGDHFGTSVALDGDVAVVGEPYDDDVNNGAGAAHVFRFDGTMWVHEAKLTNPVGAAFDYFGTSVAVSGDRVAVGAMRGTIGGQAVGAVYVYHHDGQSWAREATLTRDAPQALSWFGYATSIVGSTLLVGAYNADVGLVRSGAAYLFEHDGAQWAQRATLAPSDIEPGDQVGFAVAFDGRSLSIGAPYEDEAANDGGAGYFFAVPIGPPQITRQPSSLRVAGGARASFTVAAVGTAPLAYRWQKNLQELADGPGISGAASPRLVIAAAALADAGSYRCVVSGGCGTTSSREAGLFVDVPLGVSDSRPGPRLAFAGNHPNPFSSSTRIAFNAPGRSRVKVEIFGLRGELVATLLDGEAAPGSNAVIWQGTDARGAAVASGIYVCRISGFGQVVTRRVTRVR